MYTQKIFLSVICSLFFFLPYAQAALPAPGGEDANLVLWLKATDGVTGNPVTQWNDLSGVNNHALYVPGLIGGFTAGPEKNEDALHSISSYPVISSARDEFLRISGNLGVSLEHEIYVVKRSHERVAQNAIYFAIRPLDQSLSGLMLSNFNLQTQRYVIGSLDNDVLTLGTKLHIAPQIVTASSNGTEMTLYENGILIGKDESLLSPTISSGYDTWIGAFPQGTSPYGSHDGDIAEIIVYNASKDTGNARQRIMSYLSLKYGMDFAAGDANLLATDGTIIWDASESAHIFSVQGVGRDDDSGLGHVSSEMYDAQSIMHISADGEGTNVKPAFSDIQDGEFLIIGHDNGLNQWVDGFDSDSTVLDRTWRVQETGDVGPVTLTFDAADPDFPLPVLSIGDGYYFVYDTNNNGNLSDERPVAMRNTSGALWSIEGINLSDGQIFSLASDHTIRPVYRFWSEEYKAHFYTQSVAERDSVIATYDPSVWLYEGIAMNAFSEKSSSVLSDRQSVRRFWSNDFRSHFYTISSEEASLTVADANWRSEGDAWYAYSQAADDRLPVYRFWSDSYKSHFYTISIAERDSIISGNALWDYEGVVYYLP
jgi:hypothetical protein